MAKILFMDNPDCLKRDDAIWLDVPKTKGKHNFIRSLETGLGFLTGGTNWDSLDENLRVLDWAPKRKIVLNHKSLPDIGDKDLKTYLGILDRASFVLRSDGQEFGFSEDTICRLFMLDLKWALVAVFPEKCRKQALDFLKEPDTVKRAKSLLKSTSFSTDSWAGIKYTEDKNWNSPSFIANGKAAKKIVIAGGVSLYDLALILHLKNDLAFLADFAGKLASGKYPRAKAREFVDSADFQKVRMREEFASPAPWKSCIEGRDHWGGDSMIDTGNGNLQLAGISHDEQDFIAEGRNSLSDLMGIIAGICSTK